MRPTLAPGDRLLVRRTPLSRIRAGDIVVLAFPERGELRAERPRDDNWLIKRAVATPGDPVPASVAPVLSVKPASPVPGGALIAIGDNRDASFDSRTFGYVFADDVLGVVIRPIHTRAITSPAPAMTSDSTLMQASDSSGRAHWYPEPPAEPGPE